jgi:hypothetical protein
MLVRVAALLPIAATLCVGEANGIEIFREVSIYKQVDP